MSSGAHAPRRHFNSRPSARGDKSPGRTPGGSHISIHAPPRGATFADVRDGAVTDISIHAPPRGATVGGRLNKAVIAVFQFTPLREGRPGAFPPLVRPCGITNFNSRPSARGDPLSAPTL